MAATRSQERVLEERADPLLLPLSSRSRSGGITLLDAQVDRVLNVLGTPPRSARFRWNQLSTRDSFSLLWYVPAAPCATGSVPETTILAVPFDVPAG